MIFLTDLSVSLRAFMNMELYIVCLHWWYVLGKFTVRWTTYRVGCVTPRERPGDHEVPHVPTDVPGAEDASSLAADGLSLWVDMEERQPLPILEVGRRLLVVDVPRPVLVLPMNELHRAAGGVVDKNHGGHAVPVGALEVQRVLQRVQVLVLGVDQPHGLPRAVHLRDVPPHVARHGLECLLGDRDAERIHVAQAAVSCSLLQFWSLAMPIEIDRDPDLDRQIDNQWLRTYVSVHLYIAAVQPGHIFFSIIYKV